MKIKYVTGASNLKDYLDLPIEKRETRWGWYREPYAIEISEFPRSLHAPTAFDTYFKKTYPIQFFIRETLYYWFLKKFVWPCGHAYNKVCDFLAPKQHWLKKQIPNSWCDKTELIPQVLFACVVHFVEEENSSFPETKDKDWGIDWDAFDSHKDAYIRIHRCYRYAKIRDKLEEKTWASKNWKLFQSIYYKCEQHYLTEIIKLKDYLWT